MANKKKYPGGLFISFEGGDSVGKSSQIDRTKNVLENLGYDVLTTREPGGTVVGEQLREILKFTPKEDKACNESELLMFGAARAQILDKVIVPHLNKGGVVICDRFHDSTTVYQGYSRGIPLELVDMVHKISVGDNTPDCTILLDLDPLVGRQRNAERERIGAILDTGKAPEKKCVFEEEELEFHTKVRMGFLKEAGRHSDRFYTVDASQTMMEVSEDIIRIVKKFLP